MKVTPIRTPLIKPNNDLIQIITQEIEAIAERSVLAIASKIISFAENQFIPRDPNNPSQKQDLVRKEAEWTTEPHSSKYNLMITKKRNVLFMFAGIDESNAQDQYILWPEDPQRSANTLWRHLRSHYQLKEFGLILTDSISTPFNWGVTGISIAHCGFDPLKSYVGTKDLYNHTFQYEKLHLANCLASAAVMEMGEGNEQTPLALINNIQQDIVFQNRPPTKHELDELRVELEDDAFYPLLKNLIPKT